MTVASWGARSLHDAHCSKPTGASSISVCDRGLPPRFKGILPYSGLLRDVRWFEIDVSDHPGPIFNSQAVLLLGQLDF